MNPAGSPRTAPERSPQATVTARSERNWVEPLAVFALALALLLLPIHAIPVVWDEGLTFERQEAFAEWLGRLSRADADQWRRLWERPARDVGWRFSKEEPDGHSPFYALLSRAGDLVSNAILSQPASSRFGTATLFALTLSQVFARFRRRFDRSTAWLTVILLGTMPRLVPECSFALIDGPLVCLALLASVRFDRARETGRARDAVLVGLCLGAAMATKLTGWFLWAPYLGWTLWRMDRPALKLLLIAAPVAAATCFGFNVGWWPEPADGFRRYLVSNLTRDRTIPIPILFLGRIHPFSLPWYNTAVWTVAAVPVGTLLLGLVGVTLATIETLRAPAWFGWLRPSSGLALDPRPAAGRGIIVSPPAAVDTGFGTLLLSQWLMLMVLRALPQAPGHDGTRQIVISLGFLALLSGYAIGVLRRRRPTRLSEVSPALETSGSRPKSATFIRKVAQGMTLLGVVAAAESAASVFRYHPFGLSYYSPLIGGLPGAERLGMEPTYFWDGLTPDVLARIDELAGAGSVMFRNNPASLRYLSRWGRLKANHDPAGWRERPPTIVVYQNRPGLFLDADRRLWNGPARPLFEKRLFDVPLIRIYSFDDYRAAQREPGSPEATEASTP